MLRLQCLYFPLLGDNHWMQSSIYIATEYWHHSGVLGTAFWDYVVLGTTSMGLSGCM